MSVSNPITNLPNLHWHVTGRHPSSVEPKNRMQSIVQWFRNEQTPLLLKISAVAVPLIGVVGIGFLIGHPVMVIAALMPITTYAVYTWSKLNTAAEEVTRHAAQAIEAYRNMQEAVGGEEAFNRLPVHNVENRNGSTGYLDFLQPSDLTEPVMRGTDAAGRPFISLRLRSNTVTNPLEQQTFVITFFQRYRTGGIWAWGSGAINQARDRAFNMPLGPEERATIRRIVVDRNHPELSLA